MTIEQYCVKQTSVEQVLNSFAQNEQSDKEEI
jgi:hypothetical protein